MSLTDAAKTELSRCRVTELSARKAEATTILRFAGGVRSTNGRTSIEVELTNAATVHRLCHEVRAVFGCSAAVHPIGSSTPRYVVRFADSESLARRSGLIDGRGRAVLGLPPHIVGGRAVDVVAVWRGAFLARGSLSDPRRSPLVEIRCPGTETMMALNGAGRRLGIAARAKEANGGERLVVRDADAIGALLQRIGAPATHMSWLEQRTQQPPSEPVHRPDFDNANITRSERAGAAVAARVERAFAILGDTAPERFTDIGRLRIAHPELSLDALGKMANPPLSKDTIAGRLRRLLAMADKHALACGIPDTNTVLAQDVHS